MILAAHQPCYVPWLGYFAKIACCDRFVLLDHVQFEKQNYQNRNRIKLSSGVHWLTVPVVRGGLAERICDKRIVNGAAPQADWQRRTWRTLQQSYGKAPYFGRYAPAIQAIYESPWERLVDLDLRLLELCLDGLDIRTPLIRSSTLGAIGKKSELILDLCQRLGADTYLAGNGGSRRYLDVEALAARGVRVQWQEFVHPVYPQQHPALGFLSHLSVLDLLFNCGPGSRRILSGMVAAQGARPAQALAGV